MAPNRRRHDNHHHGDGGHGHGGGSRPLKCCVPTDCVDPGKLIYMEDIGTSDVEVVKVVCNNDHCEQGQYMHKECFEIWEQTVLTYLKSCGRARSWSEKQRLQNLWTKRGYDLAFKACSCKCGKGHLRKDLDWIPPPRTAPIAIPGAPQQPPPRPANQPQVEAPVQAEQQAADVPAPVPVPAAGEAAGKKKKKTKNREQRPTLAISAPVPHPNNNHVNNTNRGSVDSGTGSSIPRSMGHAPPFGSLGSSSSGSFDLSSSLPNSSGSSSGIGMARPRINSVSSNASGSSGSSGGGSPPSPGAQFASPLMSVNVGGPALFKFQAQRKNSKGVEVLDRTRYINVVNWVPPHV